MSQVRAGALPHDRTEPAAEAEAGATRPRRPRAPRRPKHRTVPFREAPPGPEPKQEASTASPADEAPGQRHRPRNEATRACCLVSELLEESGLDRETARLLRRQVLQGIMLLCQWQLERMDGNEDDPPRRGPRKVAIG